MTAIFAFLTLFLLLLLEGYSGNIGLPLPFFGVGVFYFVTIYRGIWLAMLLLMTGFLIDGLFMRPYPLTFLFFLALLILSHFWRKRGDLSSATTQVFPGIIIGILYILPYLPLMIPQEFFGMQLMDSLAFLITYGAIGGIMLPVAVARLDFFSEMIELKTYTGRNEDADERFR